MSGAYYNEFDPDAAAWLEELIRQGHIAPGQVDTRSIEDVRPDDLRGFTQCHFFAGIGVWSYALRRAGWPDDRPVWTGSCPCQPFSAAGKGAAFDDERHLWPAFHHLIKVGRPPSLFGEQVASSVVDDWIDLVHADLEALGYAFGSVPFPSAGVGAPHIRDRNYWVANAAGFGSSKQRGNRIESARRAQGGSVGIVGDTSGQGLAQRERERERERERGILSGASGAVKGEATLGAGIHLGGMADTRHDHDAGQGKTPGTGQPQADRSADQPSGRGLPLGRLGNSDCCAVRWDTGAGDSAKGENRNGADSNNAGTSSPILRPAGPTNGFWRDADWLGCRDGKWRPVEPGTFPLANGSSARVVRLRGYGNAINAEAAQAWIETVMECIA